jgi:hypothetical protein
MGAKSGGTIGTFLLSVPVAAILLMAVFGVPRLAPGTNGDGGGWQDPRQFFANLSGTQAQQNELFADYQGAPPAAGQDPFAGPGSPQPRGPSEAPRWGANAAAPDTASAPAPEGAPSARQGEISNWPLRNAHVRAAANVPAEEARHSRPFLGAGETPGQAGGVAETSATLTWKEARRRLAELGIKQFHLEPGFEGDAFLFVCLFSPGDDPSVTHRFEAEASEPLAAVERVLTQIDGWLEQRYASRSTSSYESLRATF